MTPQALVGYAIVTAMHVVGLAMLLALYRLLKGPSVPDRILALDTLFVAAIAQLMLFGMHLDTAVYFEAALSLHMAERPPMPDGEPPQPIDAVDEDARPDA